MYLFEAPFPEVLKASEAVINIQGEMIAGPDLRYENPNVIWRAWQKECKAVLNGEYTDKELSPKVFEYYELTKGYLQYAPKADEDTLKRVEANVTTPEPKPLFAVSYTGITTFDQCPLKWAADKDFKELPYVETEQQKWGNRVHLANENVLKQKATAEDLKILTDNDWLKYPTAMLKASQGAELFVEKEMCLTKNLKPCGWKDWNVCWFRNKSDVLIKKEKTLKYFDWKTGKRKEDDFQIEVTWAIASVHFPEVEEFDGKLVFLKDLNPVYGLEKPLTRDDLPRIWTKILKITNRMEEAWASKNYRMMKSGLCKNYCGYKKCPHCGA